MTGWFPVANATGVFRRLIFAYPGIAAGLLALTLAMKVVPAGFMPVASPGQMLVLVCTEFGSKHIAIDVPGIPAQPDDIAQTVQPCIFSGVALALLPVADPILIAAALAFILALGFAPLVLSILVPPSHVRPPLRGPPFAV